MEGAGLDWIELTGGTYESPAFEYKKESTRSREGYFIEFAEQIRPHLTSMTLAVTGGFRTASAMATAIEDKNCDIVGMARASAGEPHLPADIIAGRAQGAREHLLPDHFGIQNMACTQQMHDIGAGRPITDFNQQENVGALLGLLQKMMGGA